MSYKDALVNPRTTNGPVVHLADNSTIKSTAVGTLPLTTLLSTQAKEAHVFSELQHPLLSLGQLCDDNCDILLTKSKLIAKKNNKIILTGSRNKTDGLWDVPMPQGPMLQNDTAPIQQANIILRKDKTKMELAQWLHASCGSPSESTFIQSIKNGNFLSWPGLTASLIKKQLPKCIATEKGHLNQERKGLQSTKPAIRINPIVKIESESYQDLFPTSETPNLKTHHCFASFVSFESTAKAYSDQTGKFPFTSSRGNKYLMIVYDYDSNAILQEPLKNKTSKELVRAWLKIHKRLAVGGSQPQLYVLDNEFSTEMKTTMDKHEIKYQLVPPHIHRRNAAERAIQTFKHHFLAILASCDPDFPVSEWDRLLDQAELTLNLNRNSRNNPKLSSTAYLFGNFDFNATPLAPPGTKVQVQIKTGQRGSWSFHSENGWYIGPAPNHYRCVKCYIPSTRHERIADTVTFFPKVIPFPAVTLDDFLRQAASDIISILKNPSTLPALECGNSTKNAIVKIAELFHRAEIIPDAPTPPSSPTSPTPLLETAALPRVPIQSPVTPTVAPVVTPIDTPSPAYIPVSLPRVYPPIKPPNVPTANFDTLATTILDALKGITPNKQNSIAPQKHHRYNLRSRQGNSFRHLATQNLVAQHLFSTPSIQSAMHIYNPDTGKKETIDSLLKGPKKERWLQAASNEFGRLAQGNKYGVKATDTIEFISQSDVPFDRKVTYGSFVCDYRALKDDPYRIRLVVGGDKLEYNDDPASPAAGLLETKLLLNSVISDAHKGARFMSMDLKDHFLASPMNRPEYMKIHQRHIPQDIFEKYKLQNMVTKDGFVYVKIKKGMYGLKQAAILAYQHLVTNLAPHGYTPCKYSLGLWTHKTRPTKFCLCVDDFGVKYFSQDDADHLLSSLRSSGFTVSTDWTGKNYCGLTLDWDYKAGHVDISMPNYIPAALLKFQHNQPSRPCNAPHKWTRPAYGKQTQFAPPLDDSDLLQTKIEIRRIQAIVGTFLYYARAVDCTMLPALNQISTQQSKPTQRTNEDADMLLDFAATYPNAKIRFYASDMILHIDTDAAYLVMPNAKSRIAGYFYLSSNPKATGAPVPLNGPILVECTTIKHVVGSAAEAECGGCYHNAQKAIPIRIALQDLGHPQPKTPIKTDNSTAEGFANKSMRQKRSKAWDMRYHWIRDRDAQGHFKFYWARGLDNWADYFTKHHSPSYHIATRPNYILKNHLVWQSVGRSILNVLARVC